MFGRLRRKEQYRQVASRPSDAIPRYDVPEEVAAEIFRKATSPQPQQLVGQKTRPANITSDVTVPLLQALITGLLIALFVRYVVGNRDTWPAWGIGAFILVWLVELVEVRKLIWAAEQVFHVDLDRDKYRGQPPSMPSVILSNKAVTAVNSKGQPIVIEKNPEHIFEKFVRGCERIGTDMRQWEAYGIPRAVQQNWRDQLIRGGWALWNSYDAQGAPNTTQGWHLTSPACDVLPNCKIMEDMNV